MAEKPPPGLAVEVIMVEVPVIDDAELVELEALAQDAIDLGGKLRAKARRLLRLAREARERWGGPVPPPPPRRSPDLRVLKKK